VTYPSLHRVLSTSTERAREEGSWCTDRASQTAQWRDPPTKHIELCSRSTTEHRGWDICGLSTAIGENCNFVPNAVSTCTQPSLSPAGNSSSTTPLDFHGHSSKSPRTYIIYNCRPYQPPQRPPALLRLEIVHSSLSGSRIPQAGCFRGVRVSGAE
jgi:hypothetical protein